MAEEKKFLGMAGVERLVENLRGEITEAIEETAADLYVSQEDEQYKKLSGISAGANKVEASTTNGKIKIDGQETVVYDDTDVQRAIETLNGNAQTEGSVAYSIAHHGHLSSEVTHKDNQTTVESVLDGIESDIGNVDSLSTTNKNVVGAINEVLAAVGTGGTAAVVSVRVEETANTGAAKTYGVYQGGSRVGTIDIPKDMVVESGEVVVNPTGQAEGTYIKLVLANATNDVIYVNVGTLVDIYKAKANAAQVQIAIDSSTREISAVVVAGSITATELANDAVITAKIADKNVTKSKLAQAVQDTLDNADAKLAGLGSDTVVGLVNGINGNMNARLSETGDIGQAIKSNTERIEAIESVTYTEITAADIDTMFAD